MTPGRRPLAFVMVGALGAIVQLATVRASLTWGGMDAASATALGVGLAVAHNFVWHRHWTWGERLHRRESAARAFVRFAAVTGAVSLVGNVALVWLVVQRYPGHAVLANVAAIGACAAANYWAGDRLIFSARRDCYH